jgi:type II secretory pathway component PulF
MSNSDLLEFNPVPELRAGRLTAWHVIACYLWAILLLILAFVVPRAEAIFRDFGVPLPRVTGLVFDLSHLVSRASLPVVGLIVLLLVLAGPDWLARNARSKRGREEWPLAWSAILFVLPMLLLALAVWSVVAPFLTIMRGLSG